MDEHGVEEIEESSGGISYAPAAVTTSTKRSRVINRDYVKRWALDYASTSRMHKFSRVSESFLNMIEADTKAAIRNRIMRHPSKGKTLQ